MKTYSDHFRTIYDQQVPDDDAIGRGTHYSILRWTMGEVARDIAVIWDEDHDERVIWVMEQAVIAGLLDSVIAVGERKAGVTFLTRDYGGPEGLADLESDLLEVTEGVPSDVFGATVEPMGRASGMIINDDPMKVRAYLASIDALWQLGPKPARFRSEAFAEGE